MNFFNIIAGSASILSLLISIISLSKVINIQNKLNIDNSIKSTQSIKGNDINNSNINQAGKDIYNVKNRQTRH